MPRNSAHHALKLALLASLALPAARPALAATIRVQPGRQAAFDLVLPLRHADQLEDFVADLHNPASPNFHHWLTPQAFGLRFGPDSATMARAAAALRARGFTVTPHTRSLHATGTAAAVEQAFGIHMMLSQPRRGETHLFQDRAPTLPAELAALGAGMFSFAPHLAHTDHAMSSTPIKLDNRYGATGAYWFDDLKQAYAYPAYNATVTVNGTSKPLNGSGVTLGVLMSSDIYDADIKAMFDHENWSTISGTPDPTLAGRVYVNGGATTDSPALDEASLDTQQELTGAPGASVVLYDIPDLSDGSIFAGYVNIVEQNKVDLVSSSFSGCEQAYLPRYNGGQGYEGVLKAYHELFLQGNAQGITFLASSGDQAGRECTTVTYATGAGNGAFITGIGYPASDPAVTAVGGTNLVTGSTKGSLDSPYVSENGWVDPDIPYDIYGTGFAARGGFWGAGSGYSVIFKAPAYQALVNTGSSSRRAVPDIGMMVGGCPNGIAKLNANNQCDGGNNAKNGSGNTQRSSVVVAVATANGGGFYGVIGTSVASPELAGALALLIEQKGRQGNINPYLYGLAASQAKGQGTYFHTNIPGYNGHINTDLGPSFGLTAGVGTPIVSALVGAAGAPLSGTPQTASNP